MAKEKKAEEPKKGAPAWMATFSDMMTLLLCFFVLLFSMSSLDVAKFIAFINAYSGSTGIIDGGEVLMSNAGMLGGGVENSVEQEEVLAEAIAEQIAEQMEDMEDMKESLEEFLKSEGLENKVTVEQDGEEVILTFSDFMLFDSGQAIIKPEGLEVLGKIGGEIKQYLDDGYIARAEGHTDNFPINSFIFPSNWELSASRAISVAKYLINEVEISPMALSAEGFGEYYPIASNDTAEGRAQNRRVEIKVTKDAVE